MKRLTGVVLANGQTAEGAEMFKVGAKGQGETATKTSDRKREETGLPNSKPLPHYCPNPATVRL